MFLFFFNDTATTEIYTLSLHDALPISAARNSAPSPECARPSSCPLRAGPRINTRAPPVPRPDRKSTRLNSSHSQISYAVFCLKKKKNKTQATATTIEPDETSTTATILH